MAKNIMPVYVLSAIACFCLRSTAASVCKPHSVFKVDCNTCRCSKSGMEFSCTDIICEPLVYKDKYLIEQNEKGYSILKPKPSGDVGNNQKLNNNNDLFMDNSLSNKANLQRQQRYFVKAPSRNLNLRNVKTVKDSLDYEDLVEDSSVSNMENQVDYEYDYEDAQDFYGDNSIDENDYYELLS